MRGSLGGDREVAPWLRNDVQRVMTKCATTFFISPLFLPDWRLKENFLTDVIDTLFVSFRTSMFFEVAATEAC